MAKETEFDDLLFETDGEIERDRTKYSKYPYVMIRTESAGVYAGHLKYKRGNEVKLVGARRIWYWEGAATLSQLAMEGSKNPDKCKFPTEVGEVILLGVSEIIKITPKAKVNIESTPIWEAK